MLVQLAIIIGQYFDSILTKLITLGGFWLPNIVGAIAILLLGLFIARWASLLVKKLLNVIKINSISEKTGVNKLIKSAGIDATVSGLFSGIVYWLVLLIFINTATVILQIDVLTLFINKIIGWIPSIFAGLLIMIAGIVVAETLSKILAKIKHGDLYKTVVKWFILIIAFLTAIEQIGLNISFLTDNIKIILAGAALAFGLAFGLGGKEKAKQFLDKHLH